MVFVLAAVTSASFGAEDVEAITTPSEDSILSFVVPGRIAELLVKEGDKVKKGQVLVKLDDSVEQVQLAALKEQAENTIEIQAAQSTLNLKKIILQRKKEAYERSGAATKLEVEEATLDAEIQEMALEQKKFENRQNERKYRQLKAQIDQMRLLSPISGVVENIVLEPGEAAQRDSKVIRVVKIDPLWIEVYVPVTDARTMKVGQPVTVKFPGPGLPEKEGKIIHKAAVADAASDTLRMRVEVPNKEGRFAGEHVSVSF